MRTGIAAITFVCLCLSSAAFGQSAILKGKVIDDKEKPVSNVRIITPDGQADVTDSKGQFTIAFPTTVISGQATRIELRDKTGWVIYEPLLGNCVTQSAARNFEPLKVIIVPRGSILALSHRRIGQVVAKWADERVKLRAQVAEQKSHLDEYAFLREYTEKYGLTLEQFSKVTDQWAKIQESDDKEQRALKEYWQRNYKIAARLAIESGDEAVEDLRRINNEKLVVGRNAISRYRLAGNSFCEDYEFREALKAYGKIENLFLAEIIPKKDLLEEWAETKVLLGNAKSKLGTIVEGEESPLLLGEAVTAFREALKVYTREQLPQAWANTQNNLGIALWWQGERGSGRESVQLLAEAVAAFREALKVRTREQSPQTWADTQDNLALALRSQGERSNEPESVRLLAESVALSRESLKVYTREQNPEDWAKAQNNLGGALTRLANLGGGLNGEELVRILAEAIAAYHEALKVRTREQSPQAWAMTQNNLGAALRLQGVTSIGEKRARLLADSITAFREALKVYTREQFPQAWAGTQNSLGQTLQSQGEQASGEESVRLLAESIAAYSEALKVFTREHFPQDWANTQNNLGVILMSRGESASGEESVRFLAESIAAYSEALKVFTREHFPQQWLMAQKNLGNALTQQGKRVSGEESLRLLTESVTGFREALKAIQDPHDRRLTQNNLGNALRMLGTRVDGEEGVKLLAEAATTYREAIGIFTPNPDPMVWAAAQINLGRTLVDQAQRSGKAESEWLLNHSIIAYREALKVFTQAQTPQFWAMTQGDLGKALRLQGERSNGEEGGRLLTGSVIAYREALKVYTREQLPQDWAMTQYNLGYTYFLLKNWKDAAVCFENVLTLYPSDEQGYQSLTSIYHERLFEYAKAFDLHQKWLSRFPQDTSMLPDFAETHFTTGRFSAFSQRIKPLLTDPKLSASTKIALQMIEVANLLALDNANQVPAALAAILKTISDQKVDFRIDWSFSGTLNFINRQEEFASYRSWLNQFFSVEKEENRDAILKALRKAQAQFPAVNSNQRN